MTRVRRLVSPLPPGLVARAVADALAEDLGLAGDITTLATVPAAAKAKARFAVRAAGVVSGLAIVEATFAALDGGVVVTPVAADGDAVEAQTVIATVAGPARAILTGERVALNFLGRMSGIATLTRRYVDAVAGTAANIVDTRKTTPGLRAFEKYAVRCGGGMNHRTGLFDAILIKDNHIVAAGGLARALAAAAAHAGHLVKIEIEVDTLDQLDEVLRLPAPPGRRAAADVVLLDNMTPAMLHEAVTRVARRMLTEASGGVSLSSVRAIAQSGVDLISIGALTHSAPVLDIGLDF